MRRNGSTTGRTRIEDVARKAGVSIMSVSRAMRGVEGVSAATRAHVLAVAERLRYQPSSVAGSLAAANSTLIGFSVPTLHDEVFSDIFDAMRDVFSHAGFQTVFDTTDYDAAREEAWVERMVAWRSAGLVLSGTRHSRATRRLLRRAGVPTLEIWDHTAAPVEMCVGIDHHAAGFDMGQALARAGYHRPAYVGPHAGYDARADLRLEGFAAAFGSDVPVERVRVPLPHSFGGGRAGTEMLLARSGPRPDVIYYLNDHMAFGGMAACETLGLSVPDDIGVAGFNGLSLNEVLHRPLTTTLTPRRAMGEAGARMLVSRIALSRMGRVGEPQSTLMETTLMPGETTLPLG